MLDFKIISNSGDSDFSYLSAEDVLGSGEVLNSLYDSRKVDTVITLENVWGAKFNYIGSELDKKPMVRELYKDLSGTYDMGYMSIEECEKNEIMIYVKSNKELLLYVDTNTSNVRVAKGSLLGDVKKLDLLSRLSDIFLYKEGESLPAHMIEYWAVDSLYGSKGKYFVGYSESSEKSRGNALERFVDGEYVIAFVELI